MVEAKPIFSRKRLAAMIGALTVAIATVATISGQLVNIGAAIEKAEEMLFGARSGLVIREARIDDSWMTESGIRDHRAYTDTWMTGELVVINRGDRDATNCKASLFLNSSFPTETKLNSAVPGHGMESQFAVRFLVQEGSTAKVADVRLYCDAFISPPFQVTVPQFLPAKSTK
jgi:hypothetical protein